MASGLDGLGPLKSAQSVAEEVLATSRDPEHAIDRIVATHKRLLGATGFASGLGGFVTLAVAVPADVVAFYTLSARMVGAIAHLRGYDLASEEVRSVAVVCLLGAQGTAVLSGVGVQIGTKSATAALKRLPGRVLIEINRKVGFRLVTKFGQKGVVNLVKVVPFLGAGVGAALNVAGVAGIAKYARTTFVPLNGVDDGPIIEAEVIE